MLRAPVLILALFAPPSLADPPRTLAVTVGKRLTLPAPERRRVSVGDPEIADIAVKDETVILEEIPVVVKAAR